MSTTAAALREKISLLENELAAELAKQQAGLRFGLEHGRARFDAEALRRHRELKIGLWKYLKRTSPLLVLTAPFIYVLIIPFLVLDLFVSIYQAACFPVYGIPKVKRSDYFAFDREHLAYLNILQKLNCGYCSYVTGLIAYVREIASRTEQHWCPIKHAKRLVGVHDRYRYFAEFGDAEGFRTMDELAMPKETIEVIK